MAPLTKRQTDVAELLAWGAAKKQVAGKLHISTNTVVNTTRGIYERLGIQSIGELSAWWFTTRYEIKEAVNPILAVFFLILVGVNELNEDQTDMVRTRTCRTVRVRTGRCRRKNEIDY